jgi:acylphosphatase
MKTYHYIVKGIVQGVFFRQNTKEAALKHDIKGTVKNLYNGDVEVYAQGADENIAEFEKFLDTGPILSRVDNVIKEELDVDDVFYGFYIAY